MKKSKNFICISSFNDDLEWFKEFDYPHIIYDKCFKGIKKTKYFPYDIPPSNLTIKYPDLNIRKGEIGGYNINEYLSYIIEHYDNLPDNVVFIKLKCETFNLCSYCAHRNAVPFRLVKIYGTQNRKYSK